MICHRVIGMRNYQLCPDCIAGSVIVGGFVPQLTLMDTLTFDGVEHEDQGAVHELVTFDARAEKPG